MKYIKDVSGGGWDLRAYFEYLDGLKDRLPADLFAFARNPENYDLISHQSLHDAWLDSTLMTEHATGSRSEIRKVSIEYRFLGPYHDLQIILLYSNVSRYSQVALAGTLGNGHGDLLMHEIRLEDDDELLTHELVFSSGSVFEVTCEKLFHVIKPL